MTDEYEGLSLEERRDKAIFNGKAYGKTRLKDEFKMRPPKGTEPAFYYKSSFGGQNACYLVKDCVPIKERTTPMSEKQKLAIQITGLKNKLNSNEMQVAERLSKVDRNTICFLDTETTGLDSNDQIIELAIVDGYGEPLFNKRFKPTVEVSSGAYHVHYISNKTLENENEWPSAIDEIKSIFSGKVVYIFNKPFDKRMLRSTCKAFNIDCNWMNELQTKCMMDISASAFGSTNRYGSISLDDAASYADVEWSGNAHSALADTLATYSIFDNLITKREKIISEINELEQKKTTI